jgi:hypothetical protein
MGPTFLSFSPQPAYAARAIIHLPELISKNRTKVNTEQNLFL